MTKLVKKTPQIVRDMIEDKSQFLHFTKRYSWTGWYEWIKDNENWVHSEIPDFYTVRQNDKVILKIKVKEG